MRRRVRRSEGGLWRSVMRSEGIPVDHSKGARRSGLSRPLGPKRLWSFLNTLRSFSSSLGSLPRRSTSRRDISFNMSLGWPALSMQALCRATRRASSTGIATA